MPPLLELWDDYEEAGGAAVTSIPDPLDFEIEERLVTKEQDGEDRATLRLPLTSPAWSHFQHRHVLRLEDGADVRQWRIVGWEHERGRRGDLVLEVDAEGPIFDLLTEAELLERLDANGFVDPHFEVNQRTPAHHIDVLLGGLAPFTSAAPSYFQRGTVEPTDPVDMVYQWDTPLSALRELLGRIDGNAELSVTRTDGTAFDVNLVRQVGSSAATVYFAVGRNIRTRRSRNTTDRMATRAHPKGAEQEGESATMAENSWPISAVADPTVTLEDDILLEDGQLDGLYAEHPDGTLAEVTASRAPNEIDLDDTLGLGAGDSLTIRRDAQGRDLTYLEKPSTKSTYGLLTSTVERSDIPGVNNLLENPYLETWSGGLPDGWDSLGAPTIAQSQDEEFVRHGGSAAHVQADDGDGIATNVTPVSPSADRPYFTGQATLWLVSGAVRVELVDVTNGRTWPPGEADQDELAEDPGLVDNIGVRPGEDFNAGGTTQLQLRIVAAEDGTEFYLDAGQLTNTEGGFQTFYHARGANQLWHAANDHLRVFGEPLESHEIDVMDLTELDPSRWPDEPLVLGAPAVVHDAAADVDVSTRIRGRRWSPLQPADVRRLNLETEEQRLTALLAQTQRNRRKRKPDRPDQLQRPEDVANFTGRFPDAFLLLSWSASRGAGRYEIRKQGVGSTALERWENGEPFGNTDASAFVDRDPDSSQFALTIRALNPRTGRWSRNPTELSISAEGSDSPCENLLLPEHKPGEERCSGDGSGQAEIHAFPPRNLAAIDLAVGDDVAWGWAGKVSEAFSTDITLTADLPNLGHFNVGCAVHQAGDVLWVLNAGADLEIWDVSDPPNPSLLQNMSTPQDYHHAFYHAGRELLALSWDNRPTAIYDVSDPTSPVQQGGTFGNGVNAALWLDGGNYLATVEDNGTPGAVTLWDVTDPANPVNEGSVSVTEGRLATLTLGPGGNRINVLSYHPSDNSIWVAAIDVTDPANPSLTGETELTGYDDGFDNGLQGHVGHPTQDFIYAVWDGGEPGGGTLDNAVLAIDVSTAGSATVEQQFTPSNAGNGKAEILRVPGTKWLLYAHNGNPSGNVWALDTSTPDAISEGARSSTATEPIQSDPRASAWDPANARMWVVEHESGGAASLWSPFQESGSPDLEATVDAVFLNASGGEVDRVSPTGVAGTTYARGSATTPVPENAEEVQFIAYRRGSTFGQGCVKELQVNSGKIACSFARPAGGQCPNLLGVAATQERSSSNMLDTISAVDGHPEMDTDSNGDGVADHWQHTGGGTPSMDTWQKLVLTAGEASGEFTLIKDAGQASTEYLFDIGVEFSQDASNPTVELEIQWLDSGLNVLATAGPEEVLTAGTGGAFQRVQIVATSNDPTFAIGLVVRIKTDGTDDAATVRLRRVQLHPRRGGTSGSFGTVNLSEKGLAPGDLMGIGWAGKVDADGLQAGIEVAFLDSTGAEIDQERLTGLGVLQYERTGRSFTIPANTAALQVWSSYQGNAWGETHVKEVQLNKGSGPCEYQPPSGSLVLADVAVNVVVDTCAGGSGVEIQVVWTAGGSITVPEYDVDVTYFVDGTAVAANRDLDPQLGADSHTIAGEGSDAGTTSQHDVHVLVAVKTETTVTFDGVQQTFETTVASSQTPTVQETWGTC